MKSSVKLTLIIILGILFLLLPGLLRTYDTKIGEQSYFYERIINLIKEDNGIPDKDNLSYGGREFTYELGSVYVLLFLNKIFELKLLLNVLPILFGLITILLFYLLLKRLEPESNIIYSSLLLLIISPLFFFVFSSYSNLTIILPLTLFTIYLFIVKDKFYYLALIFLFILGFFSNKAIIVVLLFMLIYFIKQKRFKKIYLPFLVSLLTFYINYFKKIIDYGLGSLKENYLRSLLSDLGSYYGVSIFLIFFLFFGLNPLWKSKYKYIHIYLAFIIIIMLTIVNREFIVYSSFLIIYLASLGISYLVKSRWESETIRRLTIVLLIIGLLFSSYTSLISIKNSQPNNELFQALSDLRTQGVMGDVVFSHYKYGIFINSIANKKNYMDSNSGYAPNLKVRYQDMQTLFYTRSADQAKELINKYDIDYILITKEMKEGLVWNNRDEGLLFVVENSKEFRSVIKNDEVEVWKVR